MKEMKYKRKREHLKNILDWDIYDNYEYIILNLHSHPCAYVCLKSDDIFNQKHYDDIPIETHGGLTFAEPTLYHIEQYSDKYKCVVNTSISRDWIIGWDYNHYGDYNSIFHEIGHKYTTKEMLEDVHDVIRQLNEYNINYNKR